jgi:Tfp pilus assembly protein PilF
MAQYQYGDAAAWAKDWDAAEEALVRAVKLQPRLAGAWARLGNVYRAQNQLKKSIDASEQAARIEPTADALSNLADVYIADGRPDDAARAAERAIAASPDHLAGRLNLGCALVRQGRTVDGIAAFESALGRRDDFAQAHFNLGLALLKRGDFERGWRELEWRFELSPDARASRIRRMLPQWSGEPLAGKTILLHAEQGFGDTFQFARFSPIVARRASPAKVVLATAPPLHRLLRSLEVVSDVVGVAAPLPPADVQCPLMSLPLALGTTPATIPSDVPYLAAPPELVGAWRAKLSGIPGRKVGLAWAGNKRNTHDRYRSCRLNDLAAIIDAAADAGVILFSLQKGEGSEQLFELERFADRVIDRTNELNDWADTAAFIDALDLIISVDTGIAHLAGALGKRVWTMLSTAADWRYAHGASTDHSAWYPTMRLFRQETLHDWPGVAARVAAALRAAET